MEPTAWLRPATRLATPNCLRYFGGISNAQNLPNPERTRAFLIREFANHLGYAISSPCWQERPDALLTLNNGKKKTRTAIEVTDHYNDTVAGRASPRTPVSNFWELVESSLVRRISHRKPLTGILGSVRFDGRVAWPTGRGSAFTAYPTMAALIASLRILRVTDEYLPASRFAWVCADITTGHIAVNLTFIKSSIATKNKKSLGL